MVKQKQAFWASLSFWTGKLQQCNPHNSMLRGVSDFLNMRILELRVYHLIQMLVEISMTATEEIYTCIYNVTVSKMQVGVKMIRNNQLSSFAWMCWMLFESE